MKLYLAGPMKGMPDHGFPVFHAEAARLRMLGFEIVNPAELNAETKGQWQTCMIADIHAMIECDGIAMLPQWQKSKGASLEHHIMVELGKPVFNSIQLIRAF